MTTSDEWICLGTGYGFIVGGLVCWFLQTFTTQKAPYGRYATDDQTFFRREMRLPARVCWFFQELPAFLIPAYNICQSYSSQNTTNLVVLGLFIIHYTQSAPWFNHKLADRIVGSGANRAKYKVFCYPFLIKNGNPMPWTQFIMAFMFCSWNGYAQSVQHLRLQNYPSNHLSNWSSILGICLFFAGLLINCYSDMLLRNLRKNGSTGYKIPQGGLFEYVSCANYLGEGIEWTGYALVAASLPSAGFAFFTWFLLGPRAAGHHKFYLKKFENYPKDRTAIIPFLY